MKHLAARCSALLICGVASATAVAAQLDYTVSWVGSSFPGADDKWVQNFFIHMNTRPDGSCVTWSHWDEGGKRFGVYKDGDVIGNKDEKANSLEVKDKAGRTRKIIVEYVAPKDAGSANKREHVTPTAAHGSSDRTVRRLSRRRTSQGQPDSCSWSAPALARPDQ